MYTVYLRTNTVNEMQYVGQTGNFRVRNNQWNSLTQRYANQYINDDRARYGIDSFTTVVLAEVETEEESLELEKKFIKELNTLYPNGYNISEDGNKPWYGKHLSEETKCKLSEAHKGMKHTEETKRKMSYAHINGKKSKSVLQLDKVTGEVIREWPSTKEVQRQLGYAHTSISQCCNGKLNQAYGFKWRYKEKGVA